MTNANGHGGSPGATKQPSKPLGLGGETNEETAFFRRTSGLSTTPISVRCLRVAFSDSNLPHEACKGVHDVLLGTQHLVCSSLLSLFTKHAFLEPKHGFYRTPKSGSHIYGGSS